MKKLIIETLYNELFVKYLSAAKSIGYNLWANQHKEYRNPMVQELYNRLLIQYCHRKAS